MNRNTWWTWMAAPPLIKPANGTSWPLNPGYQGATVTFEWEPVTGAEGYRFTIQTPSQTHDFTVDSTTFAGQYPKGTNTWKVAALVNGTVQTWSETRFFVFE